MNQKQTGKSGKASRGVLGVLLLVFISSLVPLLFLEVVLRVSPGLISKPVLLEFPKTLRREIAIRLGLPVKQARRCISSSERYDGGPELCIAYPDFEWIQQVDEVDTGYGAQERILQDSNGFCNIGSKSERQHNDFLFIGDSFTWCWTLQPDKTFSALLESKLGYTTYNLGFPGIGPYEYVEILQRFGLKLSPKIVIMNIYEGNDLRDGIRYWRSVRENAGRGKGSGKGQDMNAERQSLLTRVIDSSYSLNFIGAAVESTHKQLSREQLNFRYRVRVEGESIPMNVVDSDRDEVKIARRLKRGEIDMELWKKALEKFVSLAQQHRFLPIVTYIPSAHTAYASSVVFEDKEVGRDVVFLSNSQREYLSTLADELSFAYFDLTPELQNAVSNGALAYFPGNVHLTERGHALIAELLAPKLRSIADSVGPDGVGKASGQTLN